MKTTLALIGLSIFLFSCHKEDPRAKDFSINYELKDQRWKSQWVEGHIKNNSPTPSTKVKIQVKMYEGLVHQDSKFIRIKDELFLGDSAKFCESVGDTISRVELVIVKVE